MRIGVSRLGSHRHFGHDNGRASVGEDDEMYLLDDAGTPACHFPEMKCFVVMPFGAKGEYGKGPREANFIYNKVVLPAIAQALRIDVNAQTVVREIDKAESGLITKAIVQRIAEAPLVIADITGLNANVFFELGLRYVLRKSGTVLIRQPNVDIPFDLQNYRCHTYDYFADGAVERLADVISATIESGEQRPDSPVYDIFPALEVDTNTTQESRMPWKEYIARIDMIRRFIYEAYCAGTYCPDAIIGITKGGASFADLLTQKMQKFTGATLALWANRNRKITTDIFDNPINRGLLGGLSEHMRKQDRELSILLVDEIIASGVTYDAAENFITTTLPGCDLRFLPMAYKGSEHFEKVAEHILWKHSAFAFDRDKIDDLHRTNWAHLPWGHEIRRT